MDRTHGLLYSPVVLVLGQKLMPEEELGNNKSDYLGGGAPLLTPELNRHMFRYLWRVNTSTNITRVPHSR
jgi:hypothetical protein